MGLPLLVQKLNDCRQSFVGWQVDSESRVMRDGLNRGPRSIRRRAQLQGELLWNHYLLFFFRL